MLAPLHALVMGPTHARLVHLSSHPPLLLSLSPTYVSPSEVAKGRLSYIILSPVRSGHGTNGTTLGSERFI